MNNESIQLTNSYWEVLKSLSSEVKLRLAARLTASVVESEQRIATTNHTEDMIQKYCGVWKDDRTSDEIIDDIISTRQDGKEPLCL